MLPKVHRIVKEKDFKQVFRKGKYLSQDLLNLKYVKNNLDKKIEQEENKMILIDCLTIYISYLMDLPETRILEHTKKIIKVIKKSRSDIIVVSNEVGSGIHPENKLGRDYRDILGKVNQIFAWSADEFYIMFAGVPIDIKNLWKKSKQ